MRTRWNLATTDIIGMRKRLEFDDSPERGESTNNSPLDKRLGVLRSELRDDLANAREIMEAAGKSLGDQGQDGGSSVGTEPEDNVDAEIETLNEALDVAVERVRFVWFCLETIGARLRVTCL